MEKLAMNLPWHGGELKLKNPVLTASGTFGYGLEYMPYGSLAALGGFITKGLSLKPMQGNPTPRIAETPCGMLNAIGLQNRGVEHFIKHHLPKLPTGADAPTVIANIYAHNTADFATLAATLAAAPEIAALEVNISCPNVESGGVLFGQSPQAAAKVTEAVKKAAPNLPVIIKLSPNVTDITEIARACASAGADMISCINTLSGMAVSLETRKPLLANVTGGLSGPAIKPVALRCVWQVANAVNIPVIAVGGAASARDVLEFIMVGAWAVEIGTANFTSPDRAFKLPAEIAELMEKLEIPSCESLRGSLKV
ncbi:dihydroorotate dehydrogenase [Desulfovibrio sp. OttesenSCG-928-F07]|nr:dihydroorotate dehydrogenase [Desulfovibrio sp. OttesenSCG-928-F07]